MKKATGLTALITALFLLLSALAGCSPTETPDDPDDPDPGKVDIKNTAFVPRLDTEATVTIDIASFFGNFEALDQVINHFNEFYPNVTIDYSGYNNTSSEDFIASNPSIDILMTSNVKGYYTDNLVDLISAGVDVDDVIDKVIDGNKIDGVLYSLPMSLTACGMAVNKTLLEKEGLAVPTTWQEFLTVLGALKEKGYTPIQGHNAAISKLFYQMGMTLLDSDPALLAAVNSGDEAGAAALKVIYERIDALKSAGYFSPEVNAGYPENNYDGAILKFFEGDVPFWVCDTENFSGTKKRESKSEAFKENPFSYEFIYTPSGDNGAHEYIEPWYGFAVNKNSDVKDYAVEFLRFMARQDELNTLASVKGVPPVAKISSGTRYGNLESAKTDLSVVFTGNVPAWYETPLKNSMREFIAGETTTADEALHSFIGKINN